MLHTDFIIINTIQYYQFNTEISIWSSFRSIMKITSCKLADTQRGKGRKTF